MPGAYGFIINTSAGSVVYTGGFRLHGTRSEATEDFINKARQSKPRVLIIEGTNIVQGRIFSEKEVEGKAGAIIKSTPGLVVASFSTVDVDRIRTFYEVAKQNGRKLTISMKQAFLLDTLQSDPDVDIFSPSDPNVLVFSRRKKTESLWETQIKDRYKNIVEGTDLCEMHDKVVLVFSFYDMNEMADIKPCPGSVFILSQSEPFDEEMELDFNKLLNWLEYYGIPLYTAHASGHASPHELKEAISQISPEEVFLMHTERPKLYQQYIRDLKIETICPEAEKAYSIG